jgi:hypothetical protein
VLAAQPATCFEIEELASQTFRLKRPNDGMARAGLHIFTPIYQWWTYQCCSPPGLL